jgi:hypothetical protein
MFLAAVLPAAVAALGGLGVQAECRRLADRSEVMRVMLIGRGRKADGTPDPDGGFWKQADELAQRIEADRAAGGWSLESLQLAERVARAFLVEVAEWSVLYDKELPDPG